MKNSVEIDNVKQSCGSIIQTNQSIEKSMTQIVASNTIANSTLGNISNLAVQQNDAIHQLREEFKEELKHLGNHISALEIGRVEVVSYEKRVSNGFHPAESAPGLNHHKLELRQSQTGIDLLKPERPRLSRTRCSCPCHEKVRLQSPSLLQPITGRAHLMFPRNIFSHCICKSSSCRNSGVTRQLHVTYFLPSLWTAKAISAQISRMKFGDVSATITISNTINYDATALRYADNGNMEGLKRLFVTNVARPNDVDPLGRSLVWVSSVFGSLIVIGALGARATSDFYSPDGQT